MRRVSRSIKPTRHRTYQLLPLGSKPNSPSCIDDNHFDRTRGCKTQCPYHLQLVPLSLRELFFSDRQQKQIAQSTYPEERNLVLKISSWWTFTNLSGLHGGLSACQYWEAWCALTSAGHCIEARVGSKSWMRGRRAPNDEKIDRIFIDMICSKASPV